jgi:hypothetical protein
MIMVCLLMFIAFCVKKRRDIKCKENLNILNSTSICVLEKCGKWQKHTIPFTIKNTTLGKKNMLEFFSRFENNFSGLIKICFRKKH